MSTTATLQPFVCARGHRTLPYRGTRGGVNCRICAMERQRAYYHHLSLAEYRLAVAQGQIAPWQPECATCRGTKLDGNRVCEDC